MGIFLGLELFYPVVKESNEKEKRGSLRWSSESEVCDNSKDELWINNTVFEARLKLKGLTKRSTTSYYIWEDELGRTFPMDILRMYEMVAIADLNGGYCSGNWTFRKGVAKKNTLKYVGTTKNKVENYNEWLALQERSSLKVG